MKDKFKNGCGPSKGAGSRGIEVTLHHCHHSKSYPCKMQSKRYRSVAEINLKAEFKGECDQSKEARSNGCNVEFFVTIIVSQPCNM